MIPVSRNGISLKWSRHIFLFYYTYDDVVLKYQESFILKDDVPRKKELFKRELNVQINTWSIGRGQPIFNEISGFLYGSSQYFFVNAEICPLVIYPIAAQNCNSFGISSQIYCSSLECTSLKVHRYPKVFFETMGDPISAHFLKIKFKIENFLEFQCHS